MSDFSIFTKPADGFFYSAAFPLMLGSYRENSFIGKFRNFR